MADLEKFIRAKYERRCWVRHDHSSSGESESEEVEPAVQSPSSIRSLSTSPKPFVVSHPSQQLSGGLNSLPQRNRNLSSSPMEELLMSLTLKSPTSEEMNNNRKSTEFSHSYNTASISDLYKPQSPQSDLSAESIRQKRLALQKQIGHQDQQNGRSKGISSFLVLS